MKQIYFKFSMLLICLVKGLGSAWAEDGTAIWNTSNGLTFGGDVINFTLSSASVTGKAKTVTLKANIPNNGEISIESINITDDSQEYDITFTNPSSMKNGEQIILNSNITNNGKGGYSITSIQVKYSYTPVTLSLTSAGYATFCAPYDVVLPSGVTASKITKCKETSTPGKKSIEMQAVASGGTLEAGTPVILTGTQTTTTTFYGIATVSEDKHSDGYLVGVYADGAKAPAGSYGLQKQDGVVAFYKASNGFSAAKYRAYLTIPAEEVKMLSFGEITIPAAISSANTEEKVSSIFSANGVKLNAMKKGLNIVKMSDGSVKKVMVK